MFQVDLLGSELLTSAYGNISFGWGLATFVGPPIAGILVEHTHDDKMPLLLTGGLLLAGAVVLLVPWIFRTKMK